MKLVKSIGNFVIQSEDGLEYWVHVYPQKNGNIIFRFSGIAFDSSFYIIRYNRAEYYMILNGFCHNGKPHTVSRIRITEFFPEWRISKMPRAFRSGVMY